MTTHPFNREKMQWLTAICKDCNVSATAFRVAYLIGNYMNPTLGEAWPSHKTLADILGIATKTVQRNTIELEASGWLKIRRSKSTLRSNRYRIARPDEYARATRDGSGLSDGHLTSNREDTNVRQSFLNNLPRTFERSRRGRSSFFDRGLYEQRIILRFGAEGDTLLTELSQHAPDLLNEICRAEQRSEITNEHFAAIRLELYARLNKLQKERD